MAADETRCGTAEKCRLFHGDLPCDEVPEDLRRWFEEPICPANAWCALPPGHDGACGLISPRQLEALQAALERFRIDMARAIEQAAEGWKAVVQAARAAQETTQGDYTLAADNDGGKP